MDFPPTNRKTGLLTVHNYISDVYNFSRFVLSRRLLSTQCASAFKVRAVMRRGTFQTTSPLPFGQARSLNKAASVRSQRRPGNYAGGTSSCWSLLKPTPFEVRGSVARRAASSGPTRQKRHSVSARQEIIAA